MRTAWEDVGEPSAPLLRGRRRHASRIAHVPFVQGLQVLLMAWPQRRRGQLSVLFARALRWIAQTTGLSVEEHGVAAARATLRASGGAFGSVGARFYLWLQALRSGAASSGGVESSARPAGRAALLGSAGAGLLHRAACGSKVANFGSLAIGGARQVGGV